MAHAWTCTSADCLDTCDGDERVKGRLGLIGEWVNRGRSKRWSSNAIINRHIQFIRHIIFNSTMHNCIIYSCVGVGCNQCMVTTCHLTTDNLKRRAISTACQPSFRRILWCVIVRRASLFQSFSFFCYQWHTLFSFLLITRLQQSCCKYVGTTRLQSGDFPHITLPSTIVLCRV